MAVEDTTQQPSLPQMIMEAIEGLNEKEGSNKSTIINYIVSNYPDLPDAHTTLLSNALDKLTQTGQLIFSNNNYLRPETEAEVEAEADPNGPPKRGRGRPPKPKVALPPGTVLGPPRPRGRPPKPRDPLAPQPQPKKPSPGTGRPRGRPRKYPAGVVPAPPANTGVKRGRGRPPKARA